MYRGDLLSETSRKCGEEAIESARDCQKGSRVVSRDCDTTIYIVAARRSDGKPPGIEKAMEERVFLSHEEARTFLLELRGSYLYLTDIAVFEGAIAIEREVMA